MKNQAAQERYEKIHKALCANQFEEMALEVDSKLELMKTSLITNYEQLRRQEIDGIAYLIDDVIRHCRTMAETLQDVSMMVGYNEELLHRTNKSAIGANSTS